MTHPDAPPAVSLSLLGTPVMRRDGAPVTGRAAYRRRLALLAVLASARGRPVGRERLMALLWPEHPPESARHTLSESLYVLRRELGEIFAGAGSEVALDPARVESDVEAFERALREGRRVEAVELYRGPFLDAFYVEGAPEFERWAQEERDRLARAFAGAVEALADEAEAAGDALGAAAWWRRLAAHDPYSSRVALRLVAALGRGGESAAALRHAEAHAAFVREELGVGLDPELAALVDRLRAETVPLAPRPAPPPHPHPAAEPDRGPHPGPDVHADAAPDADPHHPDPHHPDPRQHDPHQPDPRQHEPHHAGPHHADPHDPDPRQHEPRRDDPDRPDPRREPMRAGTADPSIQLPPSSAAGRWRRRWAPAAAGVVLLAAAGAAGLLRGDPAETEGLDPHRIAVLYFDDHSAGDALEYLAAGLTESLIHELSQVEALQVVSRNGVKPYRGGTVPLDSVVARLRVGSVVEGSVQRTGDSVRLTVQLVDAQTLAHLDSRVMVRPLDQVLALQDELSQEVASALRRRLGRELRLREARDEAGSARALDQVLRAEQLRADAEAVARSADLRDAGSALALLARADSLLAEAEARAPRWERPTVARGWVALQASGMLAGEAARERIEAAAAHAERALARRPGSAEALEVRGRAGWRATLLAPDSARLARAERDLRAALAAEPRRAGAWGTLSQVVLARGGFGEAQLAARRALEADAWFEEAAPVLLRLFFAAVGRADHPAAREACGRGARMFPADPRFVDCQLTLLRADASRAARPEEAWALVARLDALDPPAAARAAGRAYAPVYRRMVAAAVSARAGDADSARAVLARALREVRGDADAAVSLKFDEAYLLLLLGDREGARRRIAEYVAARPAMRSYVEREPVLRGLLSPP